MASTSVRFDFIGRDVSAGKTADHVRGKMETFGRTAVKALGFAATAAAGLGAAGAVMGLKTAAGLQQAEIGFETLLGSATKSKAFLGDLKKFAAATPFELPGLIDSARLLLGVGVEAKKVIPVLTDFGDAAGALGIQQEAFQRIMLATSQAISAGRFQTEDLNQITENGIPVWRLLAEATGKPVPKLRELASQGKLLADDVLPVLQRQMHKDYGGAMAKQSQTLSGLWSTFMDTLNLGLADSIQPLVPVLQKTLPGAMEVTGKALKAGSDGIADFIGWAQVMVPRVRAMFDRLKTFVPDIDYSGLRRAATRGIANAFDGLKARLPVIDFSGIGMQLKAQAETWAGALIAGVRTGIDKGDWRPLGESLGTAFGKAIVAVTGVGASLSAAVIKWAGEVDWFEVGTQVGKKSFPFAIGFVSHMTDELVATVKKHPWETALAAVFFLGGARIAGRVGKFFKTLPGGKIIGGFLEGWAATAKPINNALDWFFRMFRGGFLRRLGEMFPSVRKFLGKHVGGLGDEVALRYMYLREATGRFLKAIPDAIGHGTASILGNIGKLIARMVGMFARSGLWLVSHGARFVGGLLRGIASTSVGRTIGGVISRVTSPFRRAGSWLLGPGREVISGLLGGIRDRMAGIGGWIKSTVVDPIIRAVKNFFGIKSPSTVMAGIGGHLMAGLEQGMLRVSPGAVVQKVFGGMPKALASMVGKGLISFASLPMKALKAIGGFFGGLFGGGGGGSGVQRWAGLVVQALGMLGQPTTLLGPVLNRMRRESGGNPNAINLWDINALRGTPSKGLMQVIQPTFNAYAGPFRSAGIWNPLANIYAGLNYALHRYGSLEYAMNKPGGYRLGGIAPAGRPFIAGEDGPELLYDSRVPWAVIPNARTYGQSAASWGGGTTVIYQTPVYLNGVSLGDRQIVKDVARAVKAARQNGDLHAADLK